MKEFTVHNTPSADGYHTLQVVDDSPIGSSSSDLLEALAKEFDKTKFIHASELWYHDYREVGGVVSINANYWQMDKDEQEAFTSNCIGDSVPVTKELTSNEGVQFVQIQMSKGADQNNVSTLVRTLMQLLQDRNAKALMDLAWNDFEDEDGYENPSLRCYYVI